MTAEASVARLAALRRGGLPRPHRGERARARLPPAPGGSRGWGGEPVKFFYVERSRAWIFWRRILHRAHHRTQLTVYLRLLDRPVPPIYGPTADVSWTGADPTRTVDAAHRA